MCEEWHQEKNAPLTPFDVLYGSKKRVWWTCKKCLSDYECVVYAKPLGKGCPYCAGKKVNEYNNLLAQKPELCDEWDYEKNLKSPRDYTVSSGKKVWWVCKKCKNGWEAIINNRSIKNKGCPVCSGHKPGKYSNLKFTNPKLADEWDYEKNIKKPENFRPASKEQVWWKCSKCDYNWQARIYSRLYGGGCPRCRSSEGERIIHKILEEKNIEYQAQYKFIDCKNTYPLPFDFAVFDKKKQLLFLIEYDGIQHYEVQEMFGGVDGFFQRINNDKIKEDYCVGNNINLLRIKYDEQDNIESIIAKYMKDIGVQNDF
ncbi:zinc-ribbon domain-containing protein [Paenibacillus lautus]|uniref:zinc-ribbon domain-containing protein n=1 Tax=Paenibacillus lautus TaxID=1401 RepID=UPI001C7D2EEC|nr:zinc-ribbon domain-containing protein [Paenibacillus lautus]MBX4152233.1 hypothetical protein [Paenibacillus lautus]